MITVDPRIEHFRMQPQGLIPPGLIGLYGPPGSTKSSIAASFPKPMTYYDFDRGLHRAWGVKMQVTDQGTSVTYNGQPDLITVRYPQVPARSLTTRYVKLDGWRKAWSDFVKQFVEDCENKAIKTIVWDTATVEWSLCTDCYLEELQGTNSTRKQLQQIEYREPNSRQNSMLQAVQSYRKNLILVHHETDEYAPVTMGGRVVVDDDGNPKSAPTGRKVPDGFRYTVGKCDWVFYTKVETREVNGQKQAVATAECQKSALGLDLLGQKLDWFTYASLEQALQVLGRL